MNNNEKILWPGWETGRLIGRGSFGAVYEIQRQIFDDVEKAALKVISIPQNSSDVTEMYNDGYDSESITETFRAHLRSIVAEYSLMRKMNGSANIVNCDDVRYIQHDDGIGWDVFIKMELLTPLAETISTVVPEETVVRIARDICNALVLCNKHEIVHRDIKPQNIFVSPNGDYKLGDFGIAKTIEKTMGGTKIGTYKYMAPEVYNNQPYGSSADIYSLGLVLYWLLNERRMPFMPTPPAKLTAGIDEEARQRRFSGEQVPPPIHGSDKLKQIVLKACAYNPNERYNSAAEMLDDLNKLDIVTKIIPPIVLTPADDVMEQDATVGAVITEQDATVQMLPNQDAPVQDTPVQNPKEQVKTAQDDDKTIGIFSGAYVMHKNENENVEDNNAKEQDVEQQNGQEQNVKKTDVEVQNSEIQDDVSSDKTVGPSIITNVPHTVRNAIANDEQKPSIPKIANEQTVQQKEKSKKSKWFIPITIVTLLVLIGGIIGAIVLSNSECKHKWKEATSCTEYDTCTICGMATGYAKGHTWIKATCQKPQTCSVCGETEGIAKEHKWTMATYSKPKTCYVCGTTEGSRLAYGVNVALNKSYTGGEVSPLQPDYSAKLTDGKASNVGAIDSTWFGFHYNAGSATPSNNAPDGIGTVVIDLDEKIRNINTIRVNVFNCNDSGIVAPDSIVAYISVDGSNFSKLGNLTLPTGNDPGWAHIAVNDLSARYVKLVVDVGDGGSWCFINEIEVYAKN